MAPRKYRNALFLCFALIFSSSVSAQDIWWVGNGETKSWADAGNWFDGSVNRLPTESDVVGFGYSDSGNVSNQAQEIELVADVTVERVIHFGEGLREVTVFTGNGGRLLTTISDSIGAIRVDAGAVQNVNLNVDVGIARNTTIVQESSNAELVFGGSEIFRSVSSTGGMRARWDFNDGVIRLNGTSVPTMDTRANQGTNGVFIVDSGTSFSNYSVWTDGGVLKLAGNSSAGGAVSYANTTRIEREGTGDRTWTVGLFNLGLQDPANTEWIITPGEPGQGHLTVSTTRWREGTGWVNTAADSTVEIRSNSTLAERVMEWAANPGIGGEGNLLLNMTAASHNFEIQGRAMNYTGRTILQTGNLVLGSHTDGDTTYYGQLPTATVVEISGDAGLNLNGIDQTVGGLTGLDDSSGSVVLGGAALTIDSVATATSFGGTISGAGALVKSGEETFTFEGNYTNPVGRTLRLENGVFAVDGILSIVDGDFELAGGRVTADSLVATEVTWNVILSATAADLNMVSVATADISDASLDLTLADGYVPLVGTQFTLLYASDSISGADATNMFGYADGSVLTIDGVSFTINWVTGSESIVLSAIPEPAAVTLVIALLAGGLVIASRRRRVR